VAGGLVVGAGAAGLASVAAGGDAVLALERLGEGELGAEEIALAYLFLMSSPTTTGSILTSDAGTVLV
jgi:hypothetical protein